MAKRGTPGWRGYAAAVAVTAAVVLLCVAINSWMNGPSILMSITRAVIAGGTLLVLIFVALALFAIRRDFAGRERAEAELDRFFSLSFDFLTIASADGYFKRVSPASHELLGWTPEELTNKPWLDFVHPDDVASTILEAQKLTAGQRVLSFENRYRHKDGSWRVLSWRSTPEGDRFYGIARDVTDETRTKQELRDAKEQLESRVAERTRALEQANTALQRAYDDLRQTQQQVMQQERLRALGQMASGIAHDINNAISPVALYTESLLEHEHDISPSGAASNSRSCSARSTTWRRPWRAWASSIAPREPQLSLMPVDLNKLVDQVVDLTRARWSDMVQQRGVRHRHAPRARRGPACHRGGRKPGARRAGEPGVQRRRRHAARAGR